ncbi:hypothetical protein [Vreelandella titanicae]|uniref:hypothetical protein n=1 Tax=Vreelandella titanicae TaxID=664683 RepID=UPI003FD7E97D
MENIEDFLSELRQALATEWVADEIEETLSQGVSMNVKEAVTDSRFFDLVPSQNLSAKERNKRQKYETSRPFTEEEKAEVILKALEVIYLDLPAIRKSAIENLNVFGNIETISFSSADEELIEQNVVHEVTRESVNKESEMYREMHFNFVEELDK